MWESLSDGMMGVEQSMGLATMTTISNFSLAWSRYDNDNDGDNDNDK